MVEVEVNDKFDKWKRVILGLIYGLAIGLLIGININCINCTDAVENQCNVYICQDLGIQSHCETNYFKGKDPFDFPDSEFDSYGVRINSS